MNNICINIIGFYDLSNDPRQIKKSITIGEAFPVPKLRGFILFLLTYKIYIIFL